MTSPARQCRRQPLVAVSVAAVLLAHGVSALGERRPVSDEQRLRLALNQTAEGRWRDAPIGDVLRSVSGAFRAPLWIDRRLNPQSRVTLTVTPRALRELLNEVAATQGFAAAPIGPVVYIGPAASTAALPLIAKEWRNAAPPAWGRRTPIAWDRLSTPRAILRDIADGAGATLDEATIAELVPHDLWPERDLPAARLSDQLALALIGFDLRPALDPEDTGRVTVRSVDYDAFPQQGPKPTSKTSPPPVDESSRRYTLRVVHQPLRNVLTQLADRLGYELRAPRVEATAMAQRVSFTVEQVTVDELMQAIGRASGLEIRVRGNAIVVDKTSD